MKLTILHRNIDNPADGSGASPGAGRSGDGQLLRFAACTEPLSGIVLGCFNGDSSRGSERDLVAIPEEWRSPATVKHSNMVYYGDSLPVPNEAANGPDEWLNIADGRFMVHESHRRLNGILAGTKGDIVAVNVMPQLQAFHEKVVTTSQDKIVGFRRFYNDWAQLTPVGNDWPHYLFIKTSVLDVLLTDDALPLDFSTLIGICHARSLTVRCLSIGGKVTDLRREQGLLSLITARLGASTGKSCISGNDSSRRDSQKISADARLFGKVLLGEDVTIGRDAIIVGPTVIGDGAKIAKGAVIRTSIIAPGISVPPNQVIQNRIVVSPMPQKSQPCVANPAILPESSCRNHFRTWPRFSYARSVKRTADIVFAVLVLVLFAPFIPVIALAIKLNSKGSVFFKDARQGLHGRTFNCLKFRTMIVGADEIQQKLRNANQVDGPQFKLADDPRISTVGRFLRDTYIDEIPQFLNVLSGQMSVVGPRPSPESENALCPPWRDARLSIRPGITGLWQICRTRQPMRDFQEWIHFDIKYVKKLSLKTDLWICWRTARKLIKTFIDQF